MGARFSLRIGSALISLSLLALLAASCGTSQNQGLLPSPGTPIYRIGSSGLKQKLVSVPPGASAFTFAVMGDDRDDRLVYTEVETTLMNSSPLPQFVFNTGDLVADGGSGIEWFQFHEDSKIITDHVPLYPTVGNHDVGDDMEQTTYLHQFDPPANQLYYSFWHDHSLFIVLDANIPGQKEQITGDQLAWLQQTLDQNSAQAEHLFVFVHQPLFPVAEHKTDSMKPEDVAVLHPLFVSHHVDAVFSGHEHIYYRQEKDGITYITTGGGGAPLANFPSAYYHFVYLAVIGPAVYGWTVDLEGKTRDSFTFSR
jgi:hypothetical protein